MKHILVIDDSEESSTFLKNLITPLYKFTLLTSISDMIHSLSSNTFDLIMINTGIHDFSTLDAFIVINPFNALDSLPIIFLSSGKSPESELKYLNIGLVDFLYEPFIPQLILKKIELTMELFKYRKNLKSIINKKTETIEELNDAIFISLAELVEFRDPETGGHIKRTATYLELLVQAMSQLDMYKNVLTPRYVHDIIRSAPLHDIGKIGISDNILLKNDKFAPADFEYMKQHTTLGGTTIQKVIDKSKSCPFLSIAKDMALHHHEKWDGSGYPYGLKGYEIPLCARIMSVADVYDALTSRRRYKKAMCHEDAVKIIFSCSGTQFDPDIINVFRTMHIEFQEASKFFNKHI